MSAKRSRHAAPLDEDPLLDRAINVFEFLTRAQQLRSRRVRTTDSYETDGKVIWLADLPQHRAVLCPARAGDPAPDDPILSVRRVPRSLPPAPPDELIDWIMGDPDDADEEPWLREQPPLSDIDVDDWPDALIDVDGVVRADANPVISGRFEEWIHLWRGWAEQHRIDEPVRQLYDQLFAVYISLTAHSEEFELVLGTGCLAWRPPDSEAVRRHLLTSQATITFDDDSGQLTVTAAPERETVTVELDMLDPELITDPQRVNTLKEQAREFTAHPLNREEAGALARRLVHTLDPDGRYDDVDVKPRYEASAVAAFAPGVILRKRSQQGIVEVYRQIVNQLRDSGEVPDGIIPLVDPNHVPQTTPDLTPGALVTVDDEPFLPLQVNDKQLKIIRSVDLRAQTVVQGPPGTGKTHTAAALISHLLAQGKRVLVAAHTDRALKEVRSKLPRDFQPLSVAVVGGSREDMSDLKVAVERIASEADAHDDAHARRTVEDCTARIDELKRERAEVFRKLLESRERDVATHAYRGYEGTLASIAQQYVHDADRFDWLRLYVPASTSEASPLTNAEAIEWLALIRDDSVSADENEAAMRLVDLTQLPTPQQFADLCGSEGTASDSLRSHAAATQHKAYAGIRALPAEQRAELRAQMRDLARDAGELEHRSGSWVSEALSDVRSGRWQTWHSRAQQLNELIAQADPLVAQLGPLTDVRIENIDMGRVEALGSSLLGFLQHGAIKVAADGTPKIGAFTSKIVKQCAPIFDHVRVNGVPPTTGTHVQCLLTYVAAERILDALDRAWPMTTEIPEEDTLAERLAWHVTETGQLRQVLGLAEKLGSAERHLHELNLASPDWNDLASILAYANLVDAASAEEDLAEASEPLLGLEAVLAASTRWADTAPCVRQMDTAVQDRNHDQYAAAYQRLERLHRVSALVAQRNALGARLRTAAHALYDAVRESPEEQDWEGWLGSIEQSWDWLATGEWVLSQEGTDTNTLQAKLAVLEDRIRTQVERLAATRAWAHAVAPGRLTGQARADLHLYAQLVKRLGKGGGRYADRRRAEIRQTMDRCRTAVPVWIMPIYRVAEQLRIAPNMFDVVIVDEASQAGLEATFLQYLAPKMVVIGDDRQVSPSAVGVDQQQLRELANQYLADDPYRVSWQDPKRSFFDEAVMRYGNRITLTEHWRCVPEIIGFSNRIAYEPDGIRLIPVRMCGTDRLEPMRVLHTPDGYERGVTSRVNPVEAAAIVEQIEKCIADPQYDGKSIGVISLLGNAQAKEIEKQLLDRIAPEEWAARDLRCGDPADFQGSERDVIFLSMVATAEPGRRLGALTQEQYLQRYNVAVSRAKDQVWLVHSVQLSDLGNPADLRRQLLDYCYGVIARRDSGEPGLYTEAVPEDERVEPFDSLFEQRVFNRIIDHGYAAIPQFPVHGYRIDIVVVGATGRVAVECDGDTWHGPAQYEADLARERDLQRCGWTFHRIRESAFYADQGAVLAALWQALEQAEIFPARHDESLAPDSGGAAVPTAAATQVELTGGAAEALEPDELTDLAESWDDDYAPAEADAEPDRESVPAEPTASSPRFRDGKMLVTPAARERIWKELTTIQNWLVARHDVQSLDRLSNRAQREELQRKRSEYEARSEYLNRVLAESVADPAYGGGTWATPGCVLELRFADESDTQRHVVSLIDLGDGTTAISPSAPLGRALEGVETGDTVEYSTPHGTVSVTVISIS